MKATARNGQLLIPRHFWPRHDPRYSLARRAGRCRRVSLASKLSAEDGARLTLGYIDPATLNTEEWKHREAEGILYIPKAGQI